MNILKKNTFLFLITGGFSLHTYVMYIYVGAGVAGFILLIIFIVVATRHT